MKKRVFVALLVFLSFISQAQDWQTDFNTAKEIASAKNQKIILVFQGSDWCAPCIKLDRKIWSSEIFKSYAKNNFVLLKADFPRRKKNKLSKKQTVQNGLLAEKYNPKGHFPLVLVLDSKGNTLGTTSYKKNMSPQKYIDLLNSF